MGYSSSGSESDRDSRRHEKRHHLSSRGGSSDRERSRKSKKTKHSRRSRSRSHSHSSDRHRSSEHSHRRHGKRHSRSRSRSHSRTASSDRNSRSKSSKSRRKSGSRSRESSKVKEMKRGKKESSDRYKTESSSPRVDLMTNVQTNAQHSEKILQKALQAAVDADEVLKAQGVVLDDSRVRVKTETASFDEQQRRASAINDIENSEFTQSTFRSTRSEIPLPSGSIVDASHSGAMFGSVNATAPVAGAVSHNGLSSSAHVPDDDALMHPNLFVSAAEKMERWKRKLVQLRKRPSNYTYS